jgi:hypothetical protein
MEEYPHLYIYDWLMATLYGGKGNVIYYILTRLTVSEYMEGGEKESSRDFENFS